MAERFLSDILLKNLTPAFAELFTLNFFGKISLTNIGNNLD